MSAAELLRLLAERGFAGSEEERAVRERLSAYQDAVRAESARKAHMARMALASARARRKGRTNGDS